jgi:hypothetical protein
MIKKIMFLFVLFLFGCTPPPKVEQVSVKRIALVIGNQNYFENKLKNPINDAKGVASILEKIGFDVTLKLDITLHELNETLEELRNQIVSNETMVFIYFAGHGNTLYKNSSEEYLMMIDKEQPVLISIYKIYDFLEDVKSRYNIIAIDACRDYQKHYIKMPEDENSEALKTFRGNFRVGKIRYDEALEIDKEVVLDNNYSYKMPKSTIVSYATMHNQKAKDWSIYDDQHSPYTYALMKYLDDEEIPIEEVFRRVRVSLLKETGRNQSNLEELNLEKNIWLVPKKADVVFAPPI